MNICMVKKTTPFYMHVYLCVACGCMDMCTYTVSVFRMVDTSLQVQSCISNHTSAIEQFWQLHIVGEGLAIEDKYQYVLVKYSSVESE